MAESFSRFDAADYLDSPEDIQAYLEAAAEDGDPGVLAAALGSVARAQNMSKLARDVGLTREGLYKALSLGGNPSFGTVAKVAQALGFEVLFRPAKNPPDAGGGTANAASGSVRRKRGTQRTAATPKIPAKRLRQKAE